MGLESDCVAVNAHCNALDITEFNRNCFKCNLSLKFHHVKNEEIFDNVMADTKSY